MKEKDFVQKVRVGLKAVTYTVSLLIAVIVGSACMTSSSAKAATPILEYGDEAIYRVGDSLRDKQNNYLLKKGQSAVFTATQSHYNTLLSIHWSVNRSGVLSIVRTGGKTAQVRGIGAGVATLDGTIESAYILPGGGYDVRYMSNPFPVRVVEPISRLTLEKTQISLTKGQKDKVSIATMTPDSLYSLVFSTPITYVSSNPAVVAVDSSGNVQGMSDGTALITVSTVDGVTAVCTVSVSSGQTSTEKPSDSDKPSEPSKPSKPDKKVKVKKVKVIGEKSAAEGSKIQMKVKIKPDNATNRDVKWTSSDKKVATVNANGVVTLKKNSGGKTVTITATAKDGSGRKGTIKIKSEKKRGKVKAIKISGKKQMKAGKTQKLKASVKVQGSAPKKVKWTVDNKKYATVNASGTVKAKKAGKGKTIRVTAKATDGSGKKATFKIKIK